MWSVLLCCWIHCPGMPASFMDTVSVCVHCLSLNFTCRYCSSIQFLRVAQISINNYAQVMLAVCRYIFTKTAQTASYFAALLSLRGKMSPGDEIVVTPSLSSIGLKTKQLTEENTDFASRHPHHLSSFIRADEMVQPALPWQTAAQPLTPTVIFEPETCGSENFATAVGGKFHKLNSYLKAKKSWLSFENMINSEHVVTFFGLEWTICSSFAL